MEQSSTPLSSASTKELIMADETKLTSVQVHLPPEITPILEAIKLDRAAKCEPTSNKAIVIDALKSMRDRIANETVSQAG